MALEKPSDLKAWKWPENPTCRYILFRSLTHMNSISRFPELFQQKRRHFFIKRRDGLELNIKYWLVVWTHLEHITLPKTYIAEENPPFWWYLQGNKGVFMGYVSFREGSQNGNLPQSRGENKQNIWNHHPEYQILMTPATSIPATGDSITSIEPRCKVRALKPESHVAGKTEETLLNGTWRYKTWKPNKICGKKIMIHDNVMKEYLMRF